ncbi:hypothetical protein SNEBB_003742 [Seison nebaliae]|nr:hypothetical protein SNEBB_003742 [Seison nebaliae]
MCHTFKRILGEELGDNIGKGVCIVGTIVQVSRVGNMFDLESMDKRMLSIRMGQPMELKMDEYVEVCGIVDGENSIVSENNEIIPLPMSIMQDFDKELYVDAIKAIRTYPDAYPIEMV